MDTAVLDALRRSELRTLSKGLSCMRISGVCLVLALFPSIFFSDFNAPPIMSIFRWMAVCGLTWPIGCAFWILGLIRLRRAAQRAMRRYITAALAFMALLPAAPLAFLDPSFDKGLVMASTLAALLVIASTASTGMAVRELALENGSGSRERSRVSAILETTVVLFLFSEGAVIAGFFYLTSPETRRALLLCIASVILMILTFGPLSGLHAILCYLASTAARPPRIRVRHAPGTADATPPSSPAVGAEVRSADTTRIALPRVAVALLLAAAVAQLAAASLLPV